MRKQLGLFVGAAAVAGALVLLNPLTGLAQKGGGGHGGGGGGHAGGGGAHMGGAHPGGHPGNFNHGNFHHGGYGGFYGYPFYGYGYGGYGYGLGSYGYGSTGYYGGGYYPYYFSTTANMYPPSVPLQAFPPPQGFPPPQNFAPPQTNGGAGIQVIVPADAQVWFDGNPTQQTGTLREFETPPLDPNRTFTYQIRATWNQNGQNMDQSRTVQVRAGRHAFVDFTAPQQ